jgi:hypothetical protein
MNAVVAYPNPSANAFTINLPETASVTVYTAAGQLVSTYSNANGTFTFGNDLAAGTYLVRVASATTTTTLPLVKLAR